MLIDLTPEACSWRAPARSRDMTAITPCFCIAVTDFFLKKIFSARPQDPEEEREGRERRESANARARERKCVCVCV
jgi:hypothetical protein